MAMYEYSISSPKYQSVGRAASEGWHVVGKLIFFISSLDPNLLVGLIKTKHLSSPLLS